MSFLNLVIQPLARLGHFWQEKANSTVFRWNLFFIILQISVLIWRFTNLPSQVPLYYSLPWGETQLASASALFLLPTFSLVILLINNLFSISLAATNTLLSRLLIFASLAVSFFFLVTLVKIVYLIS
jgi:hypothetical protein